VRRTLILHVLPTAFCLLPVGAAFVIIAAVPADAMRDYLSRIGQSPIDWVILGFGSLLFTAQIVLAWRALRWVGTGFDESQDRWLNHLVTAAEWFPLLGLIGTVAAILQTFSSIGAPGASAADVLPREIIRRYAPAITATGSGLFMALMNILPTWVVQLGRDIIRSMAGGKPPAGDAG